MSEASKKLGVAITQWNHAELTIKLLKQIVLQGGVEQVVICDNASNKAEVDLLVSYLKSSIANADDEHKCTVTLLINSVNSGFSNGMNTAISSLLKTKLDWIWLLNNDVSLPANKLNQIRTSILDVKPGIYSSPMLEPKAGEFTGNFSYNKYTTKIKPIRANFELSKTPQSQRYVNGASMIVHRKVFDTIGLLNPRTFLYFEELDFTYRARKHGFLQGHLEGEAIQHLGAGSSDGKSMNLVRVYHETWSTLDFYSHHHKILFPVMLTLRTFARCLTLLVSSRRELIKIVLLATYDFLRDKNQDLSAPKIKAINQYILS
jgi:GT2 family glycosyltransferase